MKNRLIEISAIKTEWGVKSKVVPKYMDLLKKQMMALQGGDLSAYNLCKMAIDEHYQFNNIKPYS